MVLKMLRQVSFLMDEVKKKAKTTTMMMMFLLMMIFIYIYIPISLNHELTKKVIDLRILQIRIFKLNVTI